MAFLFLLPVAQPATATDEAVNMVQNPSFEFKYSPSDFGNIPSYWSRFSGDPGSFAVSTMHKQGDYSLKLTNGSSDTSVGIWSEPMSVTPGQRYTARAWATRNSSTMSAKLYLKFFDAADALLPSPGSTSFGSVGQWSEGVQTVTAPAGSAYVRLLLYSDKASTGYAYFDCVSLLRADEQVHDGGFETATNGTLPDFWSVYSTHSGAVLDAQPDGNDTRLRLVDASSTQACGAGYTVPAAPGVPYKLSISARKADGAGYASVYLKFYSADHEKLADYASHTYSTNYAELTIAEIAPPHTAYAKLLCYINSSSSGTAYFDNVSFTENYHTLYAAPAASGTGAGTSPENAARYTNLSFGNQVDAAAAASPVKVELLPGSYTQYWPLSGVGSDTNHILIAGQTPFAMDYTATSSDETSIWVYNCRNLIFRHLHFSADENPNDPFPPDLEQYDYEHALRIGRSGQTTKDIRCEGLTFTGLFAMRAAAVAPMYPGTHDIIFDNCSWARIGYHTMDHCLYNTLDCYNLLVKNCYFQDCAGTYVRFRSGSMGTVENSTFLSTGTLPAAYYSNNVFIELATFNNEVTDNETIGTNFHFNGNAFIYDDPSVTGPRCPFSIRANGYPPTSHPAYQAIPLADGAIIEDTGADLATRIQLVEQYLGINLATDYEAVGNTFSNCWALRLALAVEPIDPNLWYQSVWPTESIDCDISALIGL